MNSRNTWRSGWSLLLAISVVLWSAALCADHMSGGAEICHRSPVNSSAHQCGTEAQTEPACDKHGHSTPCCPMHPASTPQACGSAHQCCLWDGGAPPPPAIVLGSHHFPSKQLQPAQQAVRAAMQPEQSAVFLAHAARSDLYTQPVEEKKTDLRI